MSNFSKHLFDADRKAWADLGYWLSIALCIIGIAVSFARAVQGIPARAVNTSEREATELVHPEVTTAMRLLFGESVRASDFGTPVAGVVVEPITLTGILWRGDAMASFAILDFERRTQVARVGTALTDGSRVVDITTNSVLVARGSRLESLQPFLSRLRPQENPFANPLDRLARSAAPRERSGPLFTPTTDTVLSELSQMRASVVTPPPLAATRPTIRRRAGGAQAFNDPRFQHLREGVCQPPCQRSQ